MDKIALVTGATRGIGRAIALELGRQGATVIGTATSEDGAGKISAFLADAGVTGKGIVLDVTDSARPTPCSAISPGNSARSPSW